jgi:hypothetical protein
LWNLAVEVVEAAAAAAAVVVIQVVFEILADARSSGVGKS